MAEAGNEGPAHEPPGFRAGELQGEQPGHEDKDRLHLAAAGDAAFFQGLLEVPWGRLLRLFADLFAHRKWGGLIARQRNSERSARRDARAPNELSSGWLGFIFAILMRAQELGHAEHVFGQTAQIDRKSTRLN